jgi:glycosyltransferase involved in cell wall biosynthesis
VASFHTDFVSYFPFDGMGGMEPLGWRILTWFYNQCRVTYAPSHTIAEELRSQGIGGVELWERGIDPACFSPSFRSAELRAAAGAADRPLVLYVGRLVREKSLAVLADAVALLKNAGHQFALALVGDGPMGEELRRLLPDAHFAGTQRGTDLARWYASADAFVFPSTTETFGNVILEAFASGLPVVGAAQGGVRDLIAPGVNGLLARPGSADDVARCLGALLRRPELRATLARGALETAKRYRWPEVNRRLLDSYRRLLAARSLAARTA